MKSLFRILAFAVTLPALLWTQAASAAPISRTVFGDVTFVHGTLTVPYGIALGQTVSAQVDFDDSVNPGDHPINSVNGFMLTIFIGAAPQTEFYETDDPCFDDAMICSGLLPAFSTDIDDQITNINYVGGFDNMFAISVFRDGVTVMGELVDWTVFDPQMRVLAAGNFEFAEIPEPATVLLLGGGLVGLGALRRRRRP